MSHVVAMKYDSIYHFSRFTIINIYRAFMKESESEILCTDSTALVPVDWTWD
jgi:hypothetical protein